VPSKVDGRPEEILPCDLPETLVSDVQALDHRRRSHGDASIEWLGGVARDAKKRPIELARGPRVEVDLDPAAVGLRVREEASIPSDAAARRVDDGKGERGRDARVDCSPAARECDRPRIGRRRAGRHDETACSSIAP
jgi:hypothetical protein